MSKPTTHTGVITAKHSGERKRVELRETPKLWITARGTRYRKEDGRIAATWVQTTTLNLTSIRPKGDKTGLLAALAEFDATQSVRDALWFAADTQTAVEAAVDTDALALRTVQRAFHALTADLNSWEHCKHASLPFMRMIATGKPTP